MGDEAHKVLLVHVDALLPGDLVHKGRDDPALLRQGRAVGEEAHAQAEEEDQRQSTQRLHHHLVWLNLLPQPIGHAVGQHVDEAQRAGSLHHQEAPGEFAAHALQQGLHRVPALNSKLELWGPHHMAAPAIQGFVQTQEEVGLHVGGEHHNAAGDCEAHQAHQRQNVGVDAVLFLCRIQRALLQRGPDPIALGSCLAKYQQRPGDQVLTPLLAGDLAPVELEVHHEEVQPVDGQVQIFGPQSLPQQLHTTGGQKPIEHTGHRGDAVAIALHDAEGIERAKTGALQQRHNSQAH
mmetsp:Transcript_23407/g.55599  ORF Transcript_23407/g.55599 Transcript_23407/m.55599 type:complete len:293 (+) Transcript_23407:217-1095(+)